MSDAIEAAFVEVGVDVRTGIGGIGGVRALEDGLCRVVLTGPAGEIEEHLDVEVDRAVIDLRTTGFLKLVSTDDNVRLLGAHAVGEEALEVIQAVAVAMTAGADVATLASMEFAYPTYTSIIGLAAAALLREGDLRKAPADPGLI